MILRVVVAAALAVVGVRGAGAAVWQVQGQPVRQGGVPTGAAAGRAAGAEDGGAFRAEELDQMLAPIALYSDDLLTQVLMASTYPLEIVEAERWAKQNKDLKGDQLAKALEAQDWDPSVKSLVNAPDVLAMLSEKLDWTQQLGDAFIGQQDDVMQSIQRLRGNAHGAGTLQSNDHQTVNVEGSGDTQTIIIESSDPEVIYVPSYDPEVIYGVWPYPAYPPYPYYPPGYVASNVISFGLGVACGAAWGYAWGDCDWHDHDIDIDCNKNFNFNKNIDRGKFKDMNGRKWQHDGRHRGSVPYRNQAAAQRFGGHSASQASRARQDFRGRGGAGGPTTTNRPGAGGNRPNQQPAGSNRPGADRGGSNRRDTPSTNRGGDRGGSRSANRGSGGSSSRKNGGAFDGVNRGGKQARSNSSRGHSSRGHGGGGGRGGGGRGGGGRGGGGRR